MPDHPPIEDLPAEESLPDPFETFDGREVETRADWEARRGELADLFQYYVYGYLPDPPALSIETETTEGVLDGTVTLREASISLPDYPEARPITLALFLPDRDDPAPTFLALNGCGNHVVVEDDAVTITDGWRPEEFCPPASDEGRGAMAPYWAIETLLERGYGFATLHTGDVDPDAEGVAGIRDHLEYDAPAGSEWGTLAAWAWGYHRGVDYLVREAAVDAERIGIIGHSRLGKATLLAGALDDRIGLVVPHQSGTGGMALSRDPRQESIEDITEAFPHWFCDRFAGFAGRPERLPVDQHLLTALVAPRPLLDTAGLQDAWTNFPSALENLRAADEVYEFLGAEGLGQDDVLEGEPIDPDRVGSLLQYRLDTEHTLNAEYWEAILDFADARLH